MSEIIKQSMSDIWASIGDVVAPDTGKIAEGWLVEVVPRQYWNWMQNRTDTNLAYLFQHGIPEWDADVEYITNKSYVTYSDVVYKAILSGANKVPSVQPTYWKVAFATSTAALEALKTTTPAADKLPYYTGATTAATTTITNLARTLLDDTTQGEMLTTIGAQPVDATLTALAEVITATNKLPYFSGVDTASTTDLTAFGRSLIDDADAAAARTTLGLASGATTTVGSIAVQNSNSVSITGGSITGIADLAVADGGTGASDAAAARTNLGLGNVDNTSDANKPVSTAQQNALNLKAPLESPALTGVPTTPTAAIGTNTTQVASTAFVRANAVTKDSATGGAAIPNGTTAQRPASPGYGVLRANTTLNSMEWWNGVIWTSVGSGSGATGAGSGLGQDQVFMETDQLVTGDWTIGKGSMLSGCTITIASPAVITFNSHSLTVNQPVRFTTTGALPTGLSANNTYYVSVVGLTVNTFQVSLVQGGAPVNTTGTQSGIHSVGKLKNALVTKELKVASGVTVTVPTGSSLVVVGAGGESGVTDKYVNTFSAQDISGAKNFTIAPKLNGVDLTSIGVGQTWQNVLGSRALGVTYTNSTGKPIQVSVVVTLSVSGAVGMTISGVYLPGSGQFNAGFGSYISEIVPAGGTYTVSADSGVGTIFRWSELR